MRLAEAATRLKEYLADENLGSNKFTFLLAVSGGMDSMVMLELFREAGLHIHVAHMNYMLREQESDEDADFVRDHCLAVGVPCHVQTVDCKAYAMEHGLNIQVAARELRYNWFDTLKTEITADRICTAHHRDDAVETFFINLIRGTGVQGLSGIPVRRGDIIRPMMCFTRADIDSIMKSNQLSFREDSSNITDKYLRNRIRHRLLPLLDEIYLGSSTVLYDNIERFREHMQAFRALEAHLMRDQVHEVDGTLTLSLDTLEQLPAYHYLFARLGEHFGFSPVQSANLLASDKSGVHFKSHTHEMIRDRGQIIIKPISEPDQAVRIHINIQDPGSIKTPYGTLKVGHEDGKCGFTNDPNVEFFDREKLEGSVLVLRKWRHGDRIVPLGMRGSQKVSDILVNRKVSLFDKERVLVLESDEEIVWVVGHKPSELFKVQGERSAVRLHWHPGSA